MNLDQWLASLQGKVSLLTFLDFCDSECNQISCNGCKDCRLACAWITARYRHVNKILDALNLIDLDGDATDIQALKSILNDTK
jgi:hypothetical protein